MDYSENVYEIYKTVEICKDQYIKIIKNSDGNNLYLANDICNTLKLADTSSYIRKYVDKEHVDILCIDQNKKHVKMLVITDYGLQQFLIRLKYKTNSDPIIEGYIDHIYNYTYIYSVVNSLKICTSENINESKKLILINNVENHTNNVLTDAIHMYDMKYSQYNEEDYIHYLIDNVKKILNESNFHHEHSVYIFWLGDNEFKYGRSSDAILSRKTTLKSDFRKYEKGINLIYVINCISFRSSSDIENKIANIVTSKNVNYTEYGGKTELFKTNSSFTLKALIEELDIFSKKIVDKNLMILKDDMFVNDTITCHNVPKIIEQSCDKFTKLVDTKNDNTNDKQDVLSIVPNDTIQDIKEPIKIDYNSLSNEDFKKRIGPDLTKDFKKVVEEHSNYSYAQRSDYAIKMYKHRVAARWIHNNKPNEGETLRAYHNRYLLVINVKDEFIDAHNTKYNIKSDNKTYMKYELTQNEFNKDVIATKEYVKSDNCKNPRWNKFK
jgi:hypothetical protein